jgi:ankyrin repeat protein
VLVFFLVHQRADINLLDVYSDSALHWAAYKNNEQTVSLLHYLGLPADAADSYGSTPMHLAAAQGALQVIQGGVDRRGGYLRDTGGWSMHPYDSREDARHQ